MDNKKTTAIAFTVIVLFYLATTCFRTIDAGYVGVATLFGKVVDKPYTEGLYFPVNPFYSWHIYDGRQKTHKEKAAVPSQDQLMTNVEVSVQYRIISSATPQILRETGTAEDVVRVHLVPKLRSALREQGKTLKRAEEFFLEDTQRRLQNALVSNLKDFMTPQGIEIQSVLIRDIDLPAFITKAIQQKKERQQAAEKQKAELERYKTEQQQIIAQAEAERKAAEEEAQKKKILADAKAYEIEKINEAIENNKAYIQLQALDALKSISKDPSSKIYFINGESPMPLPLMHMGEKN